MDLGSLIKPEFMWFLLSVPVLVAGGLLSIRYRIGVARADGVLRSDARWDEALVIALAPRIGAAIQPWTILSRWRESGSARPEADLERLRKQLQSLRATLVVAVVGGLFVTKAWLGLTGLPEFGDFPSTYNHVRVGFWTAALIIQECGWAIWVIRWPQGIRTTLIAGVFVASLWSLALVVLGTAPRYP